MSSPSLSSLETTKKNIRILKQKLELGRDLVERSIADDGLDVDLSLTRVDAARLCSVRRARKLKRDNQLELIKDIATSKETKLNLINDSEDECLSFGDDANEGQLSDSSGAQSAPKNDYNQYFVDTGHRPQNFIRDPGLTERFEEYPKLRELIKLKDELIAKTNVPVRPMCIKSDLLGKNGDDFDPNELIGSEFDVILVEPPLHEYQITNKIYFNRFYTWEEIKAIDIGSIAASRSFIFLWCGSADGLDKGRECLKKWGFRRCEDICWIKTNKQTKTSDRVVNSTGIFQRTKEHCLMGIKGTVKRSSDTNFIHTNIDIDLIISEEPDPGVPDKPEEIFNIIEHFCLGKRRLYLFGGRHDQIRQGWLTVGPDLTQTYFDRELFRNSFLPDPNAVAGGGNLTGTTERIEMLRPRTPPAKQQPAQAVNKPITSSSVLTEVVPTDAQL